MRKEIDGKFYRKRRGVWVEIPPEWLNNVTTPCTIRHRKRAAKLKKATHGRIKAKLSYA
jgi:hypothetical protein